MTVVEGWTLSAGLREGKRDIDAAVNTRLSRVQQAAGEDALPSWANRYFVFPPNKADARYICAIELSDTSFGFAAQFGEEVCSGVGGKWVKEVWTKFVMSVSTSLRQGDQPPAILDEH